LHLRVLEQARNLFGHITAMCFEGVKEEARLLIGGPFGPAPTALVTDDAAAWHRMVSYESGCKQYNAVSSPLLPPLGHVAMRTLCRLALGRPLLLQPLATVVLPVRIEIGRVLRMLLHELHQHRTLGEARVLGDHGIDLLQHSGLRKWRSAFDRLRPPWEEQL